MAQLLRKDDTDAAAAEIRELKAERDRLASALAEQSRLLRQIMDHMPHGVYMKDVSDSFRYVLWNQRMQDLFGRSSDEVLGRSDRDLLPEKEADRQRKIDEFVIRDGAALDVPEVNISAVGGAGLTTHWIRIPVYDANGQPERLLGLVEDISEAKERDRVRRAQQGELIAASKIATLGEMAGGIAHEVNTPLQVIKGFSERLTKIAQAERIDHQEVKRCTEKISGMTERIARIVSGLKAFAAENDGDPMLPTRVQALISNALDLCQERLRAFGVELIIRPYDTDLHVLCRQAQVAQALFNLLINSFDAVQDLSEKWIRIDVETAGRMARIMVTDSGPGIPEHVAAKMLNPFFTTKDVGKGTGLGLSMARGVIAAHGGALTYDGHSMNTRFIFTLPLAARLE